MSTKEKMYENLFEVLRVSVNKLDDNSPVTIRASTLKKLLEDQKRLEFLGYDIMEEYFS